ncbi:NF-kappa-B inhibitor-like protein 1, partial [Haliaeetus albicilla]|uniref:NF-kappa-B inhibitor-like protein 1 n=1 Tax=Haliaeetus albicilla TaxID=8969 RepID=UPI0037E8F180
HRRGAPPPALLPAPPAGAGPPPVPPPPAWDESRLFRQRQREKEAQVGRAQARRSAGGPKSTGGGLKPPQAAREPPETAGDPPETAALLRFEDVPWPCPGGDAEAMASAALRGVPAPPDGPPGPYRRLLRQQRARWHPDRFARLWGGRLRPPDRARALAVATALAQALNRRADAAKGQ